MASQYGTTPPIALLSMTAIHCSNPSNLRTRVFFRIVAFGLFILALAPLLVVHIHFLTIQKGTNYLSIPHKVHKTKQEVLPSKPKNNFPSPLLNAKSLEQVSEAETTKRTSSSQHHFSSISDARSSHVWVDGCYHEDTSLTWNPYPRSAGTATSSNRTSFSPQNHPSPPSGIVVVLAAATDDPRVNRETFRRICAVVPTQIEYFLEPQGLDMLFVIQEEWGWNAHSLLSCLKLYTVTPSSDNNEHATSKTWTNLDGTTLTATPHYYGKTRDKVDNKATIYVAITTENYPTYIQEDPSILQRPITPKSCEASRKYIQATRWYTNEMLHLGILQDYDYFLKIDTDIIFVDSIPFHLLQDLKVKGALFGHTAEYHPRGSKTCTKGIHRAIQNFTTNEQKQQNSRGPAWKGAHCSSSPEVEGDIDFYYTNFIIGKVSFWQSPWVLKLSRFLSEYPHGFFSYRWTDQIFWHNAMGLFLRKYSDSVVDYTNLRCMPDPNCWFSSYNFRRYGQDAWHKCDNGGYFLHPKDYLLPSKISNRNVSLESRVWNAPSQPLFQSSYKGNCSAAKRDK